MNREGNVYTFIFASLMVIIVAGVLASISLGLKTRQQNNMDQEKMQNILRSVNITTTRQEAKTNFEKYITKTFVINSNGDKLNALNAFDINIANEIKKPLENRFLPVYVFEDQNNKKLIFPIYGKGMWGPIWGFLSFKNDNETIYGATFDHKSETPGLGAEINTYKFQQEFVGKKIFDHLGNFNSIKVVKGGAKPENIHAVDAITGGTVTSGKLEYTIEDCLIGYKDFLKNYNNE